MTPIGPFLVDVIVIVGDKNHAGFHPMRRLDTRLYLPKILVVSSHPYYVLGVLEGSFPEAALMADGDGQMACPSAGSAS